MPSTAVFVVPALSPETFGHAAALVMGQSLYASLCRYGADRCVIIGGSAVEEHR